MSEPRGRFRPSLTSAVLLLLFAVVLWVGRDFAVPPRPPEPQFIGRHAAQESPLGKDQGHVVSYVLEQPKMLNPFCTTSAVARKYVHGFTHDALLDLDPVTGDLRPALATDWQLDADGTTLLMTLREGVQFADGSALTLDDVLFTFEVARGKNVVLGQIAAGLNLVSSCAVVPFSKTQIKIVLRKKHYDAVRLVGTSFVVGKRRYFEARIAELARQGGVAVPTPDDEGFGALLAQVMDQGPGTGAYALPVDDSGHSDWRGELLLLRNEHSWARRAHVGSWNFAAIRIRYLADPAAQFVALRERSLDFYQLPDLDQVLASDASLAQDYRKVVYPLSYFSCYLVQWNLRRPVMQDVRVRQAMSMLFDRSAIVQNLLSGNGTKAVAFSMPGRVGYPQLPVPACDPAAARRLLREAGFDPAVGKPLRLTVLAPAENPLFRQILELAADAAQKAGVELVHIELDSRAREERRDRGDWDGMLGNKTDVTGACDPYETFHSAGAANVMGYADAKVDALLERARSTMDADLRQSVFLAVHQSIAQAQPVCFLVHPRAAMLINAHFRDANPGPLGLWPELFWLPRQFQRTLR